MTEEGPKARRIGMLAVSVAMVLALASMGAQAAGDMWSTPVNDATGKPIPLVLPVARTQFIAGPSQPVATDAPGVMPVARNAPAAVMPPHSVAAHVAASAPAAYASGQPGVPAHLSGLPEIPRGDWIIVTGHPLGSSAAARLHQGGALPLGRAQLNRLDTAIVPLLSRAGHVRVSYSRHSLIVADTPQAERHVESLLARVDRNPDAYGFTVTYHALAPTVARIAAVPVPKPYVLPKGKSLSSALAAYVAAHGWTLKWAIKNDYVLEAPFPIPAGKNLVGGVSYVVRAYQAQGGLMGDVPVFAMPNHVVVIRPMSTSLEDMK